MVNKELIDYIKSVKEQGYRDEAIKSSLLQNNYTQEDVDEAFKDLLLSQTPSQRESEKKVLSNQKKAKPGMIVFFIAALALLLFAGLVFAVWKFFPFSQISLPSSQCNDVELDIYHIKDEPVVCIFPDNSKVQFILINKGKIDLNKVEITVFGSNGKSYDSLENLNLKPEEVFTRTFNYNYSGMGDIQKISIVPYIFSNSRQEECGSKRIEYTQIRSC